jgi:hypothetical protein
MGPDYAEGVSKNANDASDDTSADKTGVPKLSMSQRLLTSLPNLQRPSSNGATATDVVTPDEVLAPGTEPTAKRGMFRDAFVKPPQAARQRGASSGMTKDELTHIIKRIDDREQFIAYTSAALGLVVGVVLTIAAIHFYSPPHAKNHENTSTILFEGAARVLLAGIVVWAAARRRRSFVAFALLFLGTSMAFPFALPFWAVGIWLIFRVMRWQRELAALTGTTARSTSQARTRQDPVARGRDAADARRQARSERSTARAGGGRRGKKQPEPAGPPPSKRYTPPSPTRQRPTAP